MNEKLSIRRGEAATYVAALKQAEDLYTVMAEQTTSNGMESVLLARAQSLRELRMLLLSEANSEIRLTEDDVYKTL